MKDKIKNYLKIRWCVLAFLGLWLLASIIFFSERIFITDIFVFIFALFLQILFTGFKFPVFALFVFDIFLWNFYSALHGVVGSLYFFLNFLFIYFGRICFGVSSIFPVSSAIYLLFLVSVFLQLKGILPAVKLYSLKFDSFYTFDYLIGSSIIYWLLVYAFYVYGKEKEQEINEINEVLKNARTPILITDEEGYIKGFSDELKSFFGLERISGKAEDLFPLESGQFTTPDGRNINVVVKRGVVEGLNVYIFEDITEKKEIILERDRLSEIISKIGAGLVVFRKTGEILFANRFIEKILGRKITGENSKILLEEADCPIDEIARAVKEKQFFTEEIKIRDMHFLASFSKISWDKEPAYLGILKDITSLIEIREELKKKVEELHKERLYTLSILEDLKQKEEQLKKTNKELEFEMKFIEQIINTVEAVVVVLDTNGKIVLLNRKGCDLTGYRPQEVKNKSFFELFITEDEKEGVLQVSKNLVSEKKPNSFVNHWRCKDGTFKLISWSNSVVLENGKLKYIIGTGIDITESETMRKIFIQRERLATIGEIAAGVAHELNNPLTAIMTYTDLLDDKKLTDEEKEFISKIKVSAKRMQRTVQNLLTYSRVKSKGKIASNINDVIKDALDFMEPSLKREDVAVELFLSDVPEIPLDKDELSGVFTNLFINAINALKEKQEKKIEIKSFFDEKQKKIFVLFRDNGCGIDEKNLEKIFEIFFTTREDGSGIGLAVARNVVRNHGGEISVKSKKGEWSEFSLEFPIGGGGG